ncbi:hypothetical protein BH23THE1_BH23THE1_10090 [soil metagenome]
MKNIMIISVISMITLFSIINTNYVFADNIDKEAQTNEGTNEQTRDLVQDNYQNNQCRDDAKCDNQSLEQLNNQINQCRDGANCVNESVSNIFVCEERSLCLMQYEGPFELLNPY